MHKTDLRDRKVALLGFGKSNSELLSYISRFTDEISIFDQKSAGRPESLSDQICFYSGPDCFSKLYGFDYIFRSPGIRPDHPNILSEVDRGAILTSETQLFLSECKGWTIGVTGSDGKTTTSTLIYEMLRRSGLKAFLGGNIGTPLINRLDEIDMDSYTVLELSSFQLMTFDQSPDIAVITNISPNHLDYHLSYDEYVESKKNIIRYTGKGSIVVLNGKDKDSLKYFRTEDPIIRYFNSKKGVYSDDKKIFYGDDIELDISGMLIKGQHNIENIMAAVAAVHETASCEAIQETINEFKGVEHRMEYVDTINGVQFINDSIATSPSRTIPGLRAFDEKVVLIAGGKDKGIPYDSIGREIKKHVSHLVLLGQTSQTILKSAQTADRDIAYTLAESLEDAVKSAYEAAKPSGTVFFSPASTSFDMYENFEKRGNAFKQCVKKLKE